MVPTIISLSKTYSITYFLTQCLFFLFKAYFLVQFLSSISIFFNLSLEYFLISLALFRIISTQTYSCNCSYQVHSIFRHFRLISPLIFIDRKTNLMLLIRNLFSVFLQSFLIYTLPLRISIIKIFLID